MKVIVMLSLVCVTQAFPGGSPPLIKNFMQMASGDGSSNSAQIISMQSITKNCGPGCGGTGTTPSGGGSTPGGDGGSTPGGDGGSTPGGDGGSTPGGDGGSTPGGDGGSTPGGDGGSTPGGDGGSTPGGDGGSTPGGDGGSTPGGGGGTTQSGNCPGKDGTGSTGPKDPALVITALGSLVKVVLDSLKVKAG